jgi:hypothetical protein
LSRRVSLPAADDLFRRTDSSGDNAIRAVPDERPEPTAAPPADDQAGRRTSGRVRHDEKMTVYVTSAELLELEHARLMLRGQHGVAVDRGRLVREAVALVLADFVAHGDESALVRRLTE